MPEVETVTGDIYLMKGKEKKDKEKKRKEVLFFFLIMNVTQDKRGWNHELNKGGVTCDYRHFVAYYYLLPNT